MSHNPTWYNPVPFPRLETSVKLRPLNDHVILRILAPSDTTSGGIFLPDQAREKSAKGVVVAVGPGRYPLRADGDQIDRIPMSLKEGDSVLYERFVGHDIEHEGVKYVILNELQVFAVEES